MKREILCLPCRRDLIGKLPAAAGEHVKFALGRLTVNCLCDACCARLEPGTEAYAVSMWADYGGGGYYPWEHEFIAAAEAARAAG